MRKSLLTLSAFIISTCNLMAQRELKNPLIDSKESISSGYKLYEAGKYKEAITEYLKVPVSDTNYSTVLHELILSYYMDSNFVAAETNSIVALSLFPEKKQDWYGFLANIYDDTKRNELALSTYDSILKENPLSYLNWFNKGISYYRTEHLDEAHDAFKKCILINPYYASAHYYMGTLAMKKGNLVPALMGFTACLTISPATKYKNNIVTNLTSISQINTTVNEFLQKYKVTKEDNFDEVQEIIVSKAALNKAYKAKADLDDPIVKQLQVLLEKLEFNAADKGFYMQYYVPLFKQIWDKGHFEAMVFHMFSDLEIKRVKEYMNKEKKKIASYTEDVVTYLSDIRETKELYFTKRKEAKLRYLYRDGELSGKGSYGTYKNETIVMGPWDFYYNNGRQKSQGDFNEEGKRNGDWQFYYNTGLLNEKTKYVNGNANGISEVWNDNGLMRSKVRYIDDLKDGEEADYYYSGVLNSIVNYKANKKNGSAKYFDEEGNLASTHTYVNDELDGKSTFYHKNGKVKSTENYKNGIVYGEYKEYYDDNNIKVEGFFADGEKNGLWTGFYRNKKIEYKENFVKGKAEGEYIYYYEDGKIAAKKNYSKGIIDGKYESYGDDGILWSETIYEKGRLRDIKFFDKKANVVSNTTSRKGNANVSFYTPEGKISSEGYYSKEGLAEGEHKYYFKSGSVSSKADYKDGYAEGKKTFYYPNQQVKQEGFFKKDKEDGYFTDFHINGNVSNEGWYKDGLAQGTHLGYNVLGKMIHNIYYLNSKIHGVSEYYTANGKIDNKQYFEWGWLSKIEQFDSTGKLLSTASLDKGAGKMKFVYPNGKMKFESNYKNYKLNGSYILMNGDGSRRSEAYYKNGQSDSSYISWYPNGKVQIEGNYKDGKKTGAWKYYNFEGKLTQVELFNVDGEPDGKNILYNDDETIRAEYLYNKGKLEEITHFGDNNELIISISLKKEVPDSYTYFDKTGKKVPNIPILNGTGKVESFYKNGGKSAEFSYKDDVLDGPFTFYYSNGKVKSKMTYVNGFYHGSYSNYYFSGKIKRENNYYYGTDHGSFKYYKEDGTLIADNNYFLDLQHGENKQYNNGKLTNTYIYNYGDLQSKK